MSAHPLGSATLSFGLVSVPIKLFSTGESSAAISFNWLHKKDGARLKQQYVCSKDGDKVEEDEMVKGYEFTKGQYVIFNPEELKALEEKSTNTVEITEFVPADQVDRKYVEKSYFLGPDKGGDRAYRLLAEALKQTGRVAVGQYAARGKQYLIAVRPEASGLVMEQLRYANEIRSIADVPIPKIEVKKPELQLAVQLVEQAASAAFQPDKYEDNVRKRVLEQIQRKVEGKEITEEPTEAPKTQIIDLMEALKASLKGKGATGERKPAKRVEGKGDRIVVSDGESTWSPESDQMQIDFAISDLATRAAPMARRAARAARLVEQDLSAQDWYDLGLELEVAAPIEARDAYRRALELDAHHADAHVNLGRLLHEQGLVEEAERHYRLALRESPEHATAAFNLGIALEDLGRPADAIDAYRAALATDPRLADAHYNVARLYEKAGKKAAALRHLSSYRRLSGDE